MLPALLDERDDHDLRWTAGDHSRCTGPSCHCMSTGVCAQDTLCALAHSLILACRPVSLAKLLEARQQHPDARLVAGHNEVGIERKYNQTTPPLLISISEVPELSQIQVRLELCLVEVPMCVLTNRDRITCCHCPQRHHFAAYRTKTFKSTRTSGNLIPAGLLDDLIWNIGNVWPRMLQLGLRPMTYLSCLAVRSVNTKNTPGGTCPSLHLDSLCNACKRPW